MVASASGRWRIHQGVHSGRCHPAVAASTFKAASQKMCSAMLAQCSGGGGQMSARGRCSAIVLISRFWLLEMLGQAPQPARLRQRSPQPLLQHRLLGVAQLLMPMAPQTQGAVQFVICLVQELGPVLATFVIACQPQSQPLQPRPPQPVPSSALLHQVFLQTGLLHQIAHNAQLDTGGGLAIQTQQFVHAPGAEMQKE